MIGTVSDNIYVVEVLKNRKKANVHCSCLKLYNDRSLDERALLSHVLSSEIGMVVHRLMKPDGAQDGLKVLVR